MAVMEKAGKAMEQVAMRYDRVIPTRRSWITRWACRSGTSRFWQDMFRDR